jgi:hypothetical protein
MLKLLRFRSLTALSPMIAKRFEKNEIAGIFTWSFWYCRVVNRFNHWIVCTAESGQYPPQDSIQHSSEKDGSVVPSDSSLSNCCSMVVDAVDLIWRRRSGRISPSRSRASEKCPELGQRAIPADLIWRCRTTEDSPPGWIKAVWERFVSSTF